MDTHRARPFAVLITLAFLAAACGDRGSEVVGATPETDHADHDGDHDDHADHDGDVGGTEHEGHDHGSVDVATDDAPTVALDVWSDPAGGINVRVATTDFEVAPRAASTEHVDGQGHFHLFIDGQKMLRFYNRELYVSGVPEGEIEVSVELSANDHSTYSVEGRPIVATTVFTVPPHDHGGHDHGEPEPRAFAGDAPELQVEVEPDPISGYNVFVSVSGMDLSAERASGEHVEGEGHLHIYANDQKLGRLYGTATHLPVLPAGEVEIRVAAFSNDHRPFVVDGQPVEATTTLTVDG